MFSALGNDKKLCRRIQDALLESGTIRESTNWKRVVEDVFEDEKKDALDIISERKSTGFEESVDLFFSRFIERYAHEATPQKIVDALRSNDLHQTAGEHLIIMQNVCILKPNMLLMAKFFLYKTTVSFLQIPLYRLLVSKIISFFENPSLRKCI